MANNKLKILGINTSFDILKYDGFYENSVHARDSFLDYDAVIINSDNLAENYKSGYDSFHNYCRVLDGSGLKKLYEDYSWIRNQIQHILKQGKTLYVFLGVNEVCYEQDPTTYDTYHAVNFYSFLPCVLKTDCAKGKNMEICCTQPFNNFFKNTLENSYYECYFSPQNAVKLLGIPNTNFAAAAVLQYDNGRIVFLPQPFKKSERDNIIPNVRITTKYLDALFELTKSLQFQSEEQHHVAPEWIGTFTILSEEKERLVLREKYQELEESQNSIRKQLALIDTISEYKTLVTASGLPLENIVKKVLSELGITMKETVVGRSDVIADYNSRAIVAEVKGLKGSAGEKHAAQLEKWVSEYIDATEKVPKALLIVNAFCETPIHERTKKVFPDQMLKYCHARDQCLISTTQLLCLFIDVKNHPETKDEKILELLDTVGVYEKYTNIDEYLKPVKAGDV